MKRASASSSDPFSRPPQPAKRITELARRTGRTKTYYMNEAIMERIDALEDKTLALRGGFRGLWR